MLALGLRHLGVELGEFGNPARRPLVTIGDHVELPAGGEPDHRLSIDISDIALEDIVRVDVNTGARVTGPAHGADAQFSGSA